MNNNSTPCISHREHTQEVEKPSSQYSFNHINYSCHTPTSLAVHCAIHPSIRAAHVHFLHHKLRSVGSPLSASLSFSPSKPTQRLEKKVKQQSKLTIAKTEQIKWELIEAKVSEFFFHLTILLIFRYFKSMIFFRCSFFMDAVHEVNKGRSEALYLFYTILVSF